MLEHTCIGRPRKPRILDHVTCVHWKPQKTWHFGACIGNLGKHGILEHVYTGNRRNLGILQHVCTGNAKAWEFWRMCALEILENLGVKTWELKTDCLHGETPDDAGSLRMPESLD